MLPQRDFGSMSESTHLTRTFSDQGVKLRVRKDNRAISGYVFCTHRKDAPLMTLESDKNAHITRRPQRAHRLESTQGSMEEPFKITTTHTRLSRLLRRDIEQEASTIARIYTRAFIWETTRYHNTAVLYRARRVNGRVLITTGSRVVTAHNNRPCTIP